VRPDFTCGESPLDPIQQKVVDAVNHFAAGADQEDDIPILLIRRCAASLASSPHP
jgi:hypothetical protein